MVGIVRGKSSMTQSESNRGRSFFVVALVYVAALFVGMLVARALESQVSPMIALAIADAAATVVVFLGSMAVNNSSMYDPYWSVAPMAIAPAIALRHEASGAPLVRTVIVVGLVLLWGTRLTWNWARGWQGLAHEDFRYVELRKTTGKAYWLVSFLGLHFMPTVMVYLGCLSLFVALQARGGALGALDVVALVVTLGAIVLEARADKELRAFRLTNQAAGNILDTGVWAYCRHPNYLGEILFWWGLFLFALAADAPSYWVGVGPLCINGLFVFVSVPLMTKRAMARRPAYKERIERVPALLPRPWRRVSGA
jgi:steroid 5-alpha reductase family enzyme